MKIGAHDKVREVRRTSPARDKRALPGAVRRVREDLGGELAAHLGGVLVGIEAGEQVAGVIR